MTEKKKKKREQSGDLSHCTERDHAGRKKSNDQKGGHRKRKIPDRDAKGNKGVGVPSMKVRKKARDHCQS